MRLIYYSCFNLLIPCPKDILRQNLVEHYMIVQIWYFAKERKVAWFIFKNIDVEYSYTECWTEKNLS